jgi:hypothetical protein
MINIIGDVAGQKKTLDALLAKMPKGKTVLLGDLNDRGPNSKEVIEWAMNTPDVVTLHSNHGDMFVDFVYGLKDPDHCTYYHYADFIRNGGGETLRSYYPALDSKTILQAVCAVPMEHIKWLKKLPITYEVPGLLCSHAPFEASYDRVDVVWNRSEPTKRDGVLQVFGHNAHWGLRWFDDWAVCLDTSKERKLTGMHWPSREIFQQDYL